MRVKVTKEKIDNIAEAIREGLGITDAMTLSEMPEKILDIEGFDVSDITATTDDVAEEKIFYSRNRELEYGTAKPYSFNISEFPLPSIPSQSAWSSICFGNGKLVAVCKNTDKIVYSSDWVTWNEATLPESYSWNKIVYGKGIFVVVATSNENLRVSAVSEDCENWDLYENEIGQSFIFDRICYGDGIFVLGNRNYLGPQTPTMLMSTDGVNWSGTIINSIVSDVFHCKNKFIGLSTNRLFVGERYFDFNEPRIRFETLNSPISFPTSMAYGKGLFIVVKDEDFAYSNDLVNWTESVLPVSVNSIIYYDGKFFAAGNTNKVIYSVDGITWTTIDLYVNLTEPEITCGGGKIAIIDQNLNSVIVIE